MYSVYFEDFSPFIIGNNFAIEVMTEDPKSVAKLVLGKNNLNVDFSNMGIYYNYKGVRVKAMNIADARAMQRILKDRCVIGSVCDFNLVGKYQVKGFAELTNYGKKIRVVKYSELNLPANPIEAFVFVDGKLRYIVFKPMGVLL